MKDKNKRFNHIYWILPLLIALFVVIFLIFRAFKDNCLDYKDWLAFLGSYLGFAGSVILGYVAVYQNQRLRDNNEIQHKNAIKPILNIISRKIHLLNLVDMKEYYHYLNLKNKEMSIEFLQLIPRDIRSAHREFLHLGDISSDRSVPDREYNKANAQYTKHISKLSKKYILIDFYLCNDGNGNALSIELLLGENKLDIPQSIQSSNRHACLLLLEVPEEKNSVELKFNLKYSDIDNEEFNKKEVLLVERDINGQLVLKG